MIGGPKFTSISVSCAAATFRTALTTVTSWPKWISQLEICAEEFLPVAQRVEGRVSPISWDSDPLALNLKYAYNGFSNNPQWAEGGAVLTTKLLNMNKNKPVLPGCEFVKCKKGIQKLAYSTLPESQFKLDFITHLKERLQSMSVHDLLVWSKINFDNSLAAFKKLNSRNVMKIIKNIAKHMDHLQQDQGCQ